jgi:hypothetical protein
LSIKNNILGVPRQMAGRAFRFNLFYFAEKANQKSISAAITNANSIKIKNE